MLLPGLPLGPIRGLIWLSELIREQVEQERENQSQTARQQLELVEAARKTGEISDSEARHLESELLERILESPTAGEVAQQSAEPDDR